ncbi:MAG: nickel-dependent hydrogenase large subunit [Nitriliruptorales bacterium]|nr:nickel-dependent hydrogenase large subunit [Nitriliruptorales bacterium]
MTHDHDRHLTVQELARVEGEGAMHVRVHDGRVEHVQLEIYEPPRFFEALLRGRRFEEPVDITARICGICPVAYQVSAMNAIESLCGVTVPAPIRQLRRLIYCGEWIESHVLHVFLLHAPDFLGYQSALDLAADDRGLVETALRLRKAGNMLLEIIGGRAIHPINLRLGGFYRAPARAELTALVPELEWARQAAVDAVRMVAGFDFPDLQQEHRYVALRPIHEDRPPGASDYPIENGRIVTTDGLDLPPQAWPDHFVEEQVPHSTALRARTADGATYLVGPAARFALNADRLSPVAAEIAGEVGLTPPERNPFRSIVIRTVEIVHAIDEALNLIRAYEEPDRPAVEVEPVTGTGHGVSEAPRGLLYHRYTIDDDATITAAAIVPPTSQNQRAVETDLADFVQAHLHLDDDALQWRCEQAIRNYDPCISCSTHFLDLRMERR